MALSVCLLFDGPTERALRALWGRLEALGVRTLASHTHGRHHPHLSLAVLRSWDLDRVRAAVAALPDAGPTPVHLDAVGAFRRGRVCLVPAVSAELAARQERVVEAVVGTGADLHKHYVPGLWVPHCSVATRVRLEQLPVTTAALYDVLPLRGLMTRAALIDSGTGMVHPLDTVP